MSLLIFKCTLSLLYHIVSIFHYHGYFYSTLSSSLVMLLSNIIKHEENSININRILSHICAAVPLPATAPSSPNLYISTNWPTGIVRR